MMSNWATSSLHMYTGASVPLTAPLLQVTMSLSTVNEVLRTETVLLSTVTPPGNALVRFILAVHTPKEVSTFLPLPIDHLDRNGPEGQYCDILWCRWQLVELNDSPLEPRLFRVVLHP